MSTLNKFFYWSLLAFVFLIPISGEWCVRLLIVSLLLSFFVRDGRSPLSDAPGFGWDLGVYLLVLALGLLYSTDKGTGFRVLETSFSLLALPFVINKGRAVADNLQTQLYFAFTLGLTLASILCLAVAGVKFFNGGDLHVFFSYQLTEVIRSHPTYMAYYLIFSITIGLFILYYSETKVPRFALATLLVFLFIVLMLTGGRTTFVSLLLICSFFILKWLLEPGTSWKNIVFAIVCFMIVGSFAVNASEYWGEQLAIENDYWERTALWTSAIDANANPLIGVGTGDYKDVLNDYYRTHGLLEFANESLNSHNQFIELFLSNGLLGLACLALLLARPLYLAARAQNTLGILLLFPFIIYGMNEVFLGRFQGVVFFALVHQLVVVQSLTARSMILKAG